MTCPPVKTKFAKQTGGGVEAFGIFYETQLARNYDDKMLCRICVGHRANHHMLDNYKGQGVKIILADQHASPVITDHTDWCTIIVRYSNMSLKDMIELLFLPIVKEGFESVTYDKFGFRDILGEAM